MSEQIIAAVVTHRPNGTVSSITFNGTYYVPAPDDHDFRLPHRFPRRGVEDPTRLFCDRRCPAWHEEWTYEPPRGINEEQSYVGVLHDRPEPMEPPPTDNSWVKMAPWNHPAATQGGDVGDWVRTRWLRRWKRIR
jgi:hypothetical protein